MAWNISKAKRQALVKLQLRDKKGRWIEMGGGVKWYSTRLKKQVSGTVVGTKGNNALVRLNKENPTHEPALVSVPARTITVVDSKASLAPASKPGTPTDKTSAFEKPIAVANEANGAPKSNGFQKPSDSPEDWNVNVTSDGRAYVGRKDGAELYFPARSLEVGDVLVAPEGGDETKPFSIGKGWAKKGVESVNTKGPKTGTVLRIEGDRYAVVQLPDGFTVEDKKHPGEQTDLITVGLSNSVIKLTDGMKSALGEHITDTFDGNAEEQEVDDSEEEQSDHVGREVPEEEVAAEEADPADVDLTDITDGEEEEKAAPITERAREIDVDNSGSDDQTLNENGLTDDEEKMVKAYDRMAQRAYDQGNIENGDKYAANANKLRKAGEDRRAGAVADPVNTSDTPVKEPQNAPKQEKAPEPTPEPEATSEDAPIVDSTGVEVNAGDRIAVNRWKDATRMHVIGTKNGKIYAVGKDYLNGGDADFVKRQLDHTHSENGQWAPVKTFDGDEIRVVPHVGKQRVSEAWKEGFNKYFESGSKAESSPEAAPESLEEVPNIVSEAEKQYDAIHAEVRAVRFPGEDIEPDLDDPRLKAAEDADDNARDSVQQGQVKEGTPEWYDIWNSTYHSSLEDQKSEAAENERLAEQEAESARLEAEETAEAPNLEEPDAPAAEDQPEEVAPRLTSEMLDYLPEGTVLTTDIKGLTSLPTHVIDGKRVVLHGNAVKRDGKWSGPARDLDAPTVGRWKEAPVIQIKDIPESAINQRYVTAVPLSLAIGGRPFDGDMDALRPGDYVTLKNGKKGPYSPKADGSPAITTENNNGFRQLGIKAKDIDRVKKVGIEPAAKLEETPEVPAAPNLEEPNAPEASDALPTDVFKPGMVVTHKKTGKLRHVVRAGSSNNTEHYPTGAVTTRNIKNGKPWGPVLTNRPEDFETPKDDPFRPERVTKLPGREGKYTDGADYETDRLSPEDNTRFPVGTMVYGIDDDDPRQFAQYVKIADDQWIDDTDRVLTDSDMMEAQYTQAIFLPENERNKFSAEEIQELADRYANKPDSDEAWNDHLKQKAADEQARRDADNAPESAPEPEATPEPTPEPEAAPEAAPEAPEEVVNPGEGKPTIFSQTVRGNARHELEHADESARESEYDQGYRMSGGKIEVYDFDRALSSFEDNLAPWYQYQEALPTRENPGGGYTGGHSKAKINSIVSGIEKIQEAVRAAKTDRDSLQEPINIGGKGQQSEHESQMNELDEGDEITFTDADGESRTYEKNSQGLFDEIDDKLEVIDDSLAPEDLAWQHRMDTSEVRALADLDAEDEARKEEAEEAPVDAPIVSRYAGQAKGTLAKALEGNPDSGIELDGTNANVSDIDKAQEFLRDLVQGIQAKIDDPAARKAGKVQNNKIIRDLRGLLNAVNEKQIDRDGSPRPNKALREEPTEETPEATPEAPQDAVEAPEAPAVYTPGRVTFGAAKEAINEQIDQYGDRAGLRVLPDGKVEVTDLDLAQQSLERARGVLDNRYVEARDSPEAPDLRNAWLQVGELYTKIQTESGERNRAAKTPEKTVDISPEDREKFDAIQKELQEAAVSGDMEAFKKATNALAEVMNDVNKKNSGTYVEEAPQDIVDAPEAPAYNERGLTEAEEEQYEQHLIDADVEARAGDDYGVQEYRDKAEAIIQTGQNRLNGEEEPSEESEEETSSEIETPTEAPEVEESETESEVHPLDELGIERRTPEAIAGEDYAPTQQQQDVIDAVLGGLDTKVQAMAGTGKTSTLVALSRRIGEKGGQAIYIAFNKTVQEEAVRRMKGLPVEAKTGHGVAHTWASKNMPHLTTRLGGFDPLKPVAFYKNGKPSAYAKKKAWTSASSVGDALGIKAGDVKEESGAPKTKAQIVLAVKKTVERYALSDKDTISTEHVPDTFEIAEAHLPKVVEFANEYWEDLKREDGNFRVTHDVYRKFWALSRPDLTDGTGGNTKGANILYIDEAQDTPPVLAKVVADQKMQKVIVGDANQAIYAFAENIDYLSEADGDIELPLNKSWRFGPEVADAGNRFLQMLGSDNRVVGGGGPSTVTYGMENADAVLVRTNAGMIHAILDEANRDRRVTAPNGTRANLESLVETVEALKEGYEIDTPHDDLIGFKNWEAVLSAHFSGDRSVSMIAKLFDVIDKRSLATLKPNEIAELREKKMADAKKAIDHLVIDVPLHNTLKLVQEGDRTYLEAVDENPFPVDEKGKQKPWGPNEKKWAASNFSANLGMIRKPYLKDRGLSFGDQMMKYRKEGGIETVGWKYDKGRYYTEDENVLKKFATYSGESDVTISTAHKSKGLEWDRVRIGDDFIGPYEDAKTGAIIWPEDDEYKLGYVALTRAAKELDPGSLSYVYEHTQPNGGVPGQKKNEPTTEAAPEATEEVAPEVVEDTAPEPQQIAEEPLLDATPDTDDVLDEAAKAAPAPVEETEDGEPVEAPFYDDITGLTVDEEAHKDSLLAQVKEARQRGDWNTHGQLTKEVNKMFDIGRERWKAARNAEKQNEEPTTAPEPEVEAPEPEATPEAPAPKIETPKPAPAPKKAARPIPAPAFDDEGLTPEEAARVANLEKWINDVYKGYGQGNVRKMENEVNDLLERGQKRLEGHPEAKLPVDITPEFETPAAVADAPSEAETPSLIDGVSVAAPAPKPKKVPTGRKRGAATVADANGDLIKNGDIVTHKKYGPVTVTGMLPGAGRINFIDPKTGKESSVKGDAVSLKKDEAPAEAPLGILTGTPGDRLMDPNSGKKAFIGGDGLMIVTGERVKDTKTGEVGIVQTVYTGADKKASVPVIFPGNSEPRRVRGTVLVHASNGGSDAPETAPLIPEAPEPAPEAPKAPEAPEPTPEAPKAPEPAPAPVVDEEKTARRRAAIGNAIDGSEVRSKDGSEVYTKLTADFWENIDQTDSFTDDEVMDRILNGERDGKGYIIRTPNPAPEPDPTPAPEPTPEPEAVPEPDAPLSGQELADTLTYESTLHMSDGDLAEMMSRYADDAIVFDKIMEIMDERDANVFLEVDTSKTGATFEDQPALFDIPEPVANAAAKPQRNLTPQQKASEEYENYVMSQYSRALDDLNGVLLNEAGKAHHNKDLEINIFSGSASIARKYASEELLQWWKENGRETLGSFRFRMYGWDNDRKAAQTVRNLGYERGQVARDRSNL